MQVNQDKRGNADLPTNSEQWPCHGDLDCTGAEATDCEIIVLHARLHGSESRAHVTGGASGKYRASSDRAGFTMSELLREAV